MIDILFTSKTSKGESYQEKLNKIEVIANKYNDVSVSDLSTRTGKIAADIMDYGDMAVGALSHYSPYTYPEVTALEIAMAIESGADFVELPIKSEKFENQIDELLSEIEFIEQEIAEEQIYG